jgi:(2Fe-2S) ferredoxin
MSDIKPVRNGITFPSEYKKWTAIGSTERIDNGTMRINGRCKDGPIVIAQPGGIWFKMIGKEKADDFVKEFLVEENIPNDRVLYEYGFNIIQAD